MRDRSSRSTVLIGAVTLAALMGIPGVRPLPAQAGAWAEKAPMPTGRGFGAGTVVGDKLYVLGGWNPDVDPPPRSVVESYDPKTDTWTERAAMPTPRVFMAAAALNGTLYVLGGCNPTACDLSSLEAYDPETNTWKSRAPMPSGRSYLAATAAGGKLYAIGGGGPSPEAPTAVEAYDPGTNTWAERAPMPYPRYSFATAMVGGIIYVFGGWDSFTGAPVSSVLAYDPQTNVWTSKVPIPTPRLGPAAAVIEGKVYVIGGYGDLNNNTQYLSIVEVYDPKTDSWSTAPSMPTPRQALVVGAIDDTIYAVGGQGYDSSTRSIVYLAVNEAFSPFEMVSIDIKPGDRTNTINLKSHGVVPVAILGSATFDPMTVDPSTVTFAGAPVASRGRGVAMTNESDVNHDGYPDLVLFFRTQQMTALQQMDSRLRGNDETMEAVLYGTTYSGQRIRGSDKVRIVPAVQNSPRAFPRGRGSAPGIRSGMPRTSARPASR